MLSSVALATRPAFSVSVVTCRNDHTRWSAAEACDDFRIVLVRRGTFRRKTDGRAEYIDPTLAYLGVPGEEERFAHPSGGDTCTSVSLAPALWGSLAGDARRPNASTVYVDAGLDLAHRRFLAAARTEDIDFAATERLLDLISRVVLRAVAQPTPASAPAASRDRELAAEARSVIHDGHPAVTGLVPLAALLGVSPYRLSRVFTRELGVSLTQYRNRVRVATAVDRLEAGETHLATLAAGLGFADQAHLCRTVRAHMDTTPTALRRLLT
ncbi:helix-turn-helix domain-containing protein [Streptomyces sp. NBC_01187]|uniref:helix-turn-helix domain-containing protein n=1 Tax=Streptomyces sp. NBC_01187 TaxID=2903766 RepID=UPI00386774E8|nr:helix-turn-helix transcriptional regulator [Streptomyces sp. NBC_01187]